MSNSLSGPQRKKNDSLPVEFIVRMVSGTLVLGAILTALSLSAYAAIKFIPWVMIAHQPVTFPITGEFAQISKVETGWKSSPQQVDEGKLPVVKYFPESSITLNKKSTTGKLRCLYLNEKNRYAGDLITLEFKNGKFTSVNNLSVTGSKGLNSKSDYNAYTSGYTNKWHLVILEGSTDSNSISDFKEIA